ncbi:PREDICTED: uncharacterized protein LOC109126874 [Camelina sativa]|uniref:Uncharacterized protein LOC109126874 n=1 Tax=Camelina sativa TaxID=90675 RepID=A0ABM1QHR9_CAMSA|nr:PREDICTED: uncharacterized protein LOC109126874 [Camelina sativa]
MWQQSPIGWIKCNDDGSYNTVTSQSKAGWILRNERGAFIDAGQATGIMTTSPLDSELQALLIAMQHKILNGKTLNFGCYNSIKEINYWKTRFEEVDFTWTPRKNNRPADLLAKKTLPDNISYDVYSCIPTFLLHDLSCNNY